MKNWLLLWDDVPFAIIVARDDEEAERLVYKQHDPYRGTVRRWSWKMIAPIITA